MPKTIAVIVLAFLVFIGCKEESEVIFSAKDWDWENSAKWISPKEYSLQIFENEEGIYANVDVDMIVKLPDYKGFEIVIWRTPGGDNNAISLCIVKEKIVNFASATSLDISNWSDPGNAENNYHIKTFKIYKDYMIEINTEERRENYEVQKYTKYYRINDDGEFYEVSKPTD